METSEAEMSSPPPSEEPAPAMSVGDVLARLEERVERLRRDASRLEEEKEDVLATLDAIAHSPWMGELNESQCEYARYSLERLVARALTVEARVRVERAPAHEEALARVNELIDALVVQLRDEPEAACERCRLFVATCSVEGSSPPEAASHSQEEAERSAKDAHFEEALLGCTRDDQKRIGKRLQGLFDYFTGVKFVEM